MSKKKLIISLILPFVSVGLLLILWAVISSIRGNDFLMPSIGSTFKRLFEILQLGAFYVAFGYTLLRSLIAFSISFLLAIVLAIPTAKSPLFKRFLRPIIAIIRTLPTLAVVLLLIRWTSSKVAPIIVTMLVVFPTIYTALVNSLESIDKGQIQMLNLYKVKNIDAVLKVYLPQIAPQLLINVGAGISLNLKLMVAAEVLASTARSVGELMNIASVSFAIAELIALVVVTVVIGIVIEALFNLLSSRMAKWQ